MKFNCFVTLEIEVEVEKNDPALLAEAIKNHDISFIHKDKKIAGTAYWPYGQTPAMRNEKVLSVSVKEIRIK